MTTELKAIYAIDNTPMATEQTEKTIGKRSWNWKENLIQFLRGWFKTSFRNGKELPNSGSASSAVKT